MVELELKSRAASLSVYQQTCVLGCQETSWLGSGQPKQQVSWCKQLTTHAIKHDQNVQDLLVKAVSDWFAEIGLRKFDGES